MAAYRLCVTFRQIIINKQSNTIARYYSPYALKVQNNVLSPYLLKNETHAAYPEMHVKFMPNTLNIDFGNPDNPIKKNINELPLSKIITSIQEPVIQQSIQDKLPSLDKSYELPTMENVTEKLAVRLIVIRRKKMKKHKRKKLRRKMKFIWEKIRARRNVAKEKAIQADLLSKIKNAETFDVKAYVDEKLAFIKKERIPRTYRGEILPEAMIKQFLDEKRKKKEEKRNKPRLTLD